MATKKTERAVLVTTVHRGVFFGYLLNTAKMSAKIMTLERCRNAIYWSGTRGFLGLASHGPESGSRIGSQAPSVLLHDVTSVSECSPAAVKKWESYDD